MSVAVNGLVLLAIAKRDVVVAGRPELVSSAPAPPDHRSCPQRIAAPVAAGAPVLVRPSWSAASSWDWSASARAGDGAPSRPSPTSSGAIARFGRFSRRGGQRCKQFSSPDDREADLSRGGALARGVGGGQPHVRRRT